MTSNLPHHLHFLRTKIFHQDEKLETTQPNLPKAIKNCTIYWILPNINIDIEEHKILNSLGFTTYALVGEETYLKLLQGSLSLHFCPIGHTC